MFGIEPVLFGEAAALSPIAVVSLGRIGSLSLLGPLLLLSYGFTIERRHVRPVGISGALDGVAPIALAAATAIGPVSTATVLVAQIGTLSAIVGVWALKERPSVVRIVGIVLAVVAVTLLAMSDGG